MIRDLSNEEFTERYGADRFTATVLANRFRYTVEHVCGRLLTAAFSPIAKFAQPSFSARMALLESRCAFLVSISARTSGKITSLSIVRLSGEMHAIWRCVSR